MASKKKVPRKATRPKPRATRTSSKAQEGMWPAALEALHKAQGEAEKQVASLLKRSRFRTRDISKALREIRRRYEQERKRVVRQVGAQIETLEGRLSHERKSLTHVVDEAVRNALAALNIPSRKEVAELGRKVDRLSKKIDGLRRR